MDWNTLADELWQQRQHLEQMEPVCSVMPRPDRTGLDALDDLHEAEQDALGACEEWLQSRYPLYATGAGAKILDLRLEFAANMARCLAEAGFPIPPEYNERSALSWLLCELCARTMQPLLDRMWLEHHGFPEE